jgi:hypothetical protein
VSSQREMRIGRVAFAGSSSAFDIRSNVIDPIKLKLKGQGSRVNAVLELYN